MELEKIYNENCLDTMARMSDGVIDLTITSPPYDNLRTYNGYEFEFDLIAPELYRVTKDGGVVVWVVGDATVKGSETGTSFRQALTFKEIGFNLETMIWKKENPFNFGSNHTYIQAFEFMFVLSKGKPATMNFIRDRKVLDLKPFKSVRKDTSNNRHYSGTRHAPAELGKRYNVWTYPVGESDKSHPAIFPVALALDHILTWSNEGELVYDPFIGSGTTARAAHQLKRRWIGSEISTEYVESANENLKSYLAQESLF
jgi:site-specific DNA-methyltransferase (adenine-specific)